jgi:predicted DNA-binding transcriptional regulator AlpA
MTKMPDSTALPTDWWTADQCAAYLGIARSTWAAYVSRQQAPQPERMFGRSPAWRPKTVKAWAAARPRRGN